ncbi:MAG: tetratricopeptide repeat protein [Deltaproteobacteria bacterium]|nr:tetratricopeptide repeat protein [Deltaproteobacteria bacterium]
MRNHNFIRLDDDEYVTENSHVNTGLSWDNITWAFTSTHAANWHPVTWLSHMLDCELFGLNPKGHHLTSILFHLLNTLLLFLILQRMTGTLWRSGFVAGLFALHPLHVESVAWVAERKDVLSTFFMFLTLWSYIWYVERPGLYRYLLIILFFTLGLMAKPMLVTLPFVLLLLDYWPLERIQLCQSDLSHPGQSQPAINHKKLRTRALGLLLEKTPLFVLAAVSSLITFLVQRSGGAVGALEIYPFHIRIANALLSYLLYITKMIWPQNLAVLYPHPGQSLPMWQAAGAGLLLLVISIVVIRAGRRYPYLPVGWLWYLGTLVPVIGLVQVGSQAMADRYTYVALIGLFVIIAWGVTDLLGSWQYSKPALILAATSLLSVLMVCSFFQVSHWKNSLTLFEHTLRATSNNSQIHNNLANVLTQQGKIQEAISHYTKALEINPNYGEAHINLGAVLAYEGKLEEAIKHYSLALQLKPNSPELHNNLGVALCNRGDIPGAIDHYLAAVQLKPDYAEAYNNLGNALAQQDKLAEAEVYYSKALMIRADYPEAHNNLGVALARQGRLNEAIAHFSEAVRLKPDYMQARANLELALQEAGKSN